jgi:hypothetical protein
MRLKHIQDTTTPLLAPAARQGGTAGCPSSEVRLARGLDAPSGEVRLARVLNAPRARSASLEGSTPTLE